ncbi:MAG: DUF4191 domain-containing protein [Nocardioidaceae bacterium]
MAEQERPGLIEGIRMTYRLTKKTDKAIPWILLGTFVGAFVVGFALFYLLPGGWLWMRIVGGILVGTLATMVMLTRRSTKSMYAQLEGSPAAAGRALQMLRRGWITDTTPVAFTKQQDLVFRVVGPPGVILVAEGNPNRVKTLLASERRRHERVVADVPVVDVLVGNGDGEVPLPKLTRTLTKMKRVVKPAEITDIQSRLRALDASGRNMPIPKGPVPTSMKGQRGNLRGR